MSSCPDAPKPGVLGATRRGLVLPAAAALTAASLPALAQSPWPTRPRWWRCGVRRLLALARRPPPA